MTATLTPTDRPQPPAPPEPAARPRSARERLALAALLVATAALYLWNLAAVGWGNAFYAGAVQAMTRNWTAFLFGSSDAGNTVTVDKPPAALWIEALSARVFGLSSWSVLVPEVLMGVATVALLYAAVRRVTGPGAALVAGVAMALTPVAVLMFRYDNPDALLVLLMVAAAYAVVRALEHAGTRWLLLAGALMGLAFLTKTAESFVVLPGLALAYLWAAPTGLGRRIRQLLAAGVALIVTGGWWFALVQVWPAASRPYIGGSTDNSALQLAFGYNGLSRILGGGFGRGTRGGTAGFPGGEFARGHLPGGFPAGGFRGGAFGGPFGGGTGLGRMFASDVGGQVAWMLPAALVLLVVGLVLTARAARTDRLRASLLLWGGWAVVTALVFSLMQGIFHQYYTVALAPGVAALVGIGGAVLWRRRGSLAARLGLAAIVLGTAGWAFVLLGRTPEFVPWLRWVVLLVGLLAALLVALPGRLLATAGLVAAVMAGSLGPAAYAAQTVGTAHDGAIPLAGPAQAAGLGGFARARGDRPARAGVPAAFAGRGPGEEQADPALVALLRSAGTNWSAATTGAMSAAPLALASGTDVMGIGGFSGADPAPTLAQFRADVAAGKVHYFIAGGGGPGRGDTTITGWVEQHFTAQTVGGRTVYDLTRPRNA